jgi:hypothetical protein
VRLLIEPHDRQLVGLNNDSNKLKKMPKGVRGEVSRLLLKLIKKRGLSRGLKVVRSLMSLMWLLQPQPRAAGAQSELQCDFYNYIYQPRPIELTAKFIAIISTVRGSIASCLVIDLVRKNAR